METPHFEETPEPLPPTQTPEALARERDAQKAATKKACRKAIINLSDGPGIVCVDKKPLSPNGSNE